MDDAQSLTMLVSLDGETLEQLLLRLDRAIDMAVEENVFTDEINCSLDDRI